MTATAMARPREHILALEPYRLAAPSETGRRVIRLDQNELGLLPSPAAAEAARRALGEVNRYPEVGAAPLRAAIAAAEGLDAARILCGVGSMELLGLVAQAYLQPGEEALMSLHGYLYFRSAAAAAGARVVLAPEQDLRADVDALLASMTPRTRILFLANPNNPTGSLMARREVERLRSGLREDIILLLDAAYAEFVEEPEYEPGARLVDAMPNTVMLRSFSKIHGLAGLRVGWGYFPAGIAEVLGRIRHPNSVTGPGMAAAAAAIADRAHVAQVKRSNIELRDTLFQGLKAQGLTPYPGHGNFLLVSFETDAKAAAADRHLRKAGILLRPMAGYGLGHCLRASVGTAEEINLLLGALATWRASSAEPMS